MFVFFLIVINRKKTRNDWTTTVVAVAERKSLKVTKEKRSDNKVRLKTTCNHEDALKAIKY